MKKLLLSLTILTGLGLTASAQTSPIKFGVKAGATFSNMSFSGSGVNETGKLNTSFYFGGTVDIPVSEMFSVQPGLLYVGKGTKDSGDFSEFGEGGSGKAEATLNPHYLEIPLNIVANFESGNGKFFVGAGPYYAIGIAGKVKVKATDGSNSVEVKNDIEYGDDKAFKRGDFGINLLTGYQLNNGFNIHAGYGLGLSNIINAGGEGKAKNRVLSVGLGYSF